MNWTRHLLPDHRASGQVLPWVIAVMVYLAALAVAGEQVLSRAVDGWRSDLAHTVSVQIVSSDPYEVERQTRMALEVLNETPGVKSAKPLSRPELLSLLEPWLGRGNISGDLPVPQLIDVSLEPGAELDFAIMETQLKAAAPNARLDTHQDWLDRLIRLARSVQTIATCIVVLIGLATVAIVVFATRAGLAADQHVIEVLHLIGARDSFIANRFQLHFFTMGLRGGVIGLIITGLTLAVLSRFTSDLSAAFIPTVSLSPMAYLSVALVPVAAALVTMLTARVTVTRSLARMT